MKKILDLNFNKREFVQLLKNKDNLSTKENNKYLKYQGFIEVQFYRRYGERFLGILENYVKEKNSGGTCLYDFFDYDNSIFKISNEFLDQVVEKPTLLDHFQVYSNAEEFYKQVEMIQILDETRLDNALSENPLYDFDTEVKKIYYTMKRLMEESKITLLPSDTQLVNNNLLVREEKFDNQVISRLIWFSSLISLGSILIGSFLSW
jgi:hypothetical protein